MLTATPDDRLGRALDATGDLITGVKPNQWTNATPCPEWNVRALVNHLVSGNRMFAGIIRGEPMPPRGNLSQFHVIDGLGDDPIAAYREAGTELLVAFSEPTVCQRVSRFRLVSFQAP